MHKIHKVLTLKKISLLIGLIYFIALLVTMPAYNLVWDARNHYFKGQAFVNYFLYGRKDYEGLSITKDALRYYRDYGYKYSPDPNIENRLSLDPDFRRSIYQDDVHTFNWLIKSDQIEHPVLSDNLAALSNIIFYEKLGWLRDDYAYRVYTLLLAAVLVGVIFYWAYRIFGLFPAFVAMLSLGLTPLFWSESHFNLKDVPQTAFFSLAIWQFFYGAIERSKKKIIYSAIFAGCSLGTKLNIVFLPFIVIPWVVFYCTTQVSKLQRIWYIKSIWVLFVYAIIAFLLFFISWPQLWYDPIKKLSMVLGIYYEIGIAPDYTPEYRTFFNFSTYAVTWIFYSTYPLVLALGIVGIVGAFKNISKHSGILLLFLLWLLIPIIRASLPFTSIFGGVRHIMEYIPAFSMLTGYGAFMVLQKVSKKYKRVVMTLMVLGFIPLVVTITKLHPAENTYFNFLIGGLSGAKNANMSGWSYNDGGVYRKAVTWLNEHAEKNSHVATAFSEPADFFIPELRFDLRGDNQYSGYLQKGEYIIALTHDTGLEHTYRMRFLENTQVPVYEYVVDGVPLIKIYKNDKNHVKEKIAQLKEKAIRSETMVGEKELRWDLGKAYTVGLVAMEFTPPKGCVSMSPVNLTVSENNEDWEMLAETYPGSISEDLGEQPKGEILTVPIPNVSIRYVVLFTDVDSLCFPQSEEAKFVVFEK